MRCMQELEARLEAFLAQEPSEAEIIREIKQIALESYRNGQQAGAPAPKTEQPRQPANARYTRNYQR
jgi:hypothetical protein